MDVWDRYVGKKVFLRTRNERTYSGMVLKVEKDQHLIFITIRDNRKMLVTFVHSEITEIKEEN